MDNISIPGSRILGEGGINGLYVLVGISGVVLIYSGVKNATIADTARGLVRGIPVPTGPRTVPAATGRAAGPASATGQAVADKALTYVGVKYVWAGEDPKNGWDCSGFVTYVLHHDFGISLPDNVHTVTGQFLIWDGADTVPRNQAAPGDLACWATHIGIVIDQNTMVHAPGLGQKTQTGPIGLGVTIRRPLAYAKSVGRVG